MRWDVKEVILEGTTNDIDERQVNFGQESGTEVDDFGILNETLCGLVDWFHGKVRCEKEYRIDSSLKSGTEFPRSRNFMKLAQHAMKMDYTAQQSLEATIEDVEGEGMERMGVG